MEIKKKLSIAFFSLAILVFVFYACKKDETVSSTETVNTSSEDAISTNFTNQSELARGTGTQTYYSKNDSTGVYYKMNVSWSTSGVISVNRTVITSGYPTGTETGSIIEDGLTIITIDDDTDTTAYDTLVVKFERNKKYYAISFEPNSTGNYARYEVVGDGGFHM